jgi:hypothetical protein
MLYPLKSATDMKSKTDTKRLMIIIPSDIRQSADLYVRIIQV